MPSEHRRRKDDTWTQDELNKALKVPKHDMHRKKKHEDDGDRRSHHEESDRRRHRDDDSRSHRRNDEKRQGKRNDSPEVQLTEEDRERMRRERREKREGGKEEKKHRPTERKSEHATNIDDNDDQRQRHRRREEDHENNKRHSKDDESRRHRDDEGRRHRDDGDRRRRDDGSSRRHRDEDSKKHRDDENRHHRDDGDRRRRDDGSSRHRRDEDSKRHRDDENRERRHRDTDSERRKHHKEEESSSRRHRGDEEPSHRRRQHEDDGSSSRRHHADEESQEDRERRRQERREKRDQEKRKEKDGPKEKVSEKEESGRSEGQGRHERHRDREEKSEHRRSKQETKPPVIPLASNGRVREQQTNDNDGDDDYNYEEDFEDYEDDFEDDDDPEMKEEGEMEEVLRALDEENNRLQLDSHRSNWSDSTELSDERFKDNREEEERKSRAALRGKTFINFVSAKQRVMDQTVASRARKRFDDLSKLIELDVAKYDMFDLPPVKEYELYIRSFGRSDTQQAYVQTHDDDIDRDIQTDEIETLSKWTQHPPDQEEAVGGEGITVVSNDETKPFASKADPERLTKFLDKVGKFLFTILDEESGGGMDERERRNAEPKASFSQASWYLGKLDFLEARQITNLCFCPSDPNSLLSVHSLPYFKEEPQRDFCDVRPTSPEMPYGEQFQINSMYLVCVWNLSQSGYPYRICASEMKINCACFSPTKASLVFAGMEDGSMTLWDLREPASQHKTFAYKDRGHLLRFPTYMTAGVLETENHSSPVVAMTPVYSSIVGSLRDEETAESRSGLSFQLASVEEKAIVNLWVIAEIAIPDIAGSQNDLGLSPGGKIKLLKSSSIVLNNPNKYLAHPTDLRAMSLRLNPGDLNHFYVPTDSGCVVHGVRFGSRVFPQAHCTPVDSPVPVVSIDFSPFGQPYFLAACKDGTLHLFNTKMEKPISSWRDFISGETILSVRWSHSRPAVFFVLDNNSTMFTFDLVENGLAPMKMDVIRTADAKCFEIGSDPNLLASGVGVSRPAHIALALDNGSVECSAISEEMRKQQPLEEEFLASYSDRY